VWDVGSLLSLDLVVGDCVAVCGGWVWGGLSVLRFGSGVDGCTGYGVVQGRLMVVVVEFAMRSGWRSLRCRYPGASSVLVVQCKNGSGHHPVLSRGTWQTSLLGSRMGDIHW
jgi:hypothetical protein